MWRLGAWVSGAALICSGVGACGHEPRIGTDAAEAPDAMPPGCGDGIVQPEVFPPLVLSENCDEGPMNGTAESLCALDCRVKQAVLTIQQMRTLPLPAKKLVVDSPGPGIVASSFDDRGIAVFGFLPGPGWTFVRAGGVPTDFVLHMMDEPVGDPGLLDLVWIERSATGTGPLRFYWMELDPDVPPVIQELAFPVPNVTQAMFAHRDFSQTVGALILSVVADGRLYLVEGAGPLGTGGWLEVADLGPAPATELGRAVHVYRSNVQESDILDRIVAFFGGGPTEVRTAIYTEETPPPRLVTSFGTTWPGSVVSADDGFYRPQEEYVHRLAVLAADGTVDVWDFDHTPDEIEPTQYGRMPSGTRQISTAMQWPAAAVIGVVNDGSLAVLANNGVGEALATQRFQIGPPCEVCGFSVQIQQDYQPSWVVLDNVAYKFRLTIAGE